MIDEDSAPVVRDGTVVPDSGPELPRRPVRRDPEVPRELLRPRAQPRDLPVGREALTLPLLYTTVAGLGGVRVTAEGALLFVPPTLMALVLALLLLAVMVRSGALGPGRLVHERRSPLENTSGLVVVVSFAIASAQVFTLLTPAAGLLSFVFTTFFLLLLWNTLAVEPDRRQVLRSLAVVFGGAFVLKFVVLAAVYDPDGGAMRRVVLALLQGASMGTLGFQPDAPATGYLAFVTLLLYFVGIVMLPSRQRS